MMPFPGAKMKGLDLPKSFIFIHKGRYYFSIYILIEKLFFGLKKKIHAGQSSQGGEDLISDLTEDVMNLILVCLPIKVAVWTSILSKKWRYKWISIPDIDFNENCLSANASETEYALTVDQVLLHHVGPIRKFSCRFYKLISSHIGSWLMFLSRNGIKKLILKQNVPRLLYVPSSIFYCLVLCHLELFNCIISVPPTFQGFHNLMVLKLYYADMSEDEIAYLILKSPLLESLTLSGFCFDQCININAPNLRYLDLEGTFSDLSLGSSPHLTVLSIELELTIGEPENKNRSMAQFTGCSQVIERLALKGEFLRFLCRANVPEKVCATYDHLKYLDMHLDLKRSLPTLLFILRSSPNLKELKINCAYEGEDDVYFDVAEFWGAQTQLGCLFSHLRAVEIFEIFDILFHLELIRYVLANAPVLETMKISISHSVEAEEICKMLEELLQLRRASTQAKIIIHH